MHVVRLFEQDVMIRAGHFPVRWYPDVSAGYGSAHPQFYAPLFYLAAQPLYSAGLPIDLALKLTVAGVLLASSFAMYRLVARWFGPGAGLVAAAAVSYAPYHLVDLFVRASFSELTVFATLPLMLVAFERLVRVPHRRHVVLAALAFAALLLSHTITTMLAPALLGLWVALLNLNSEYRVRAQLRSVGAATMLGFGLAAFFLIPLALERGHIDVQRYTEASYSWGQHFVYPLQLLWSPWGFGPSVEGMHDGFSFRLGELHIVGLLLGLWLCLRTRRVPRESQPVVWFAAVLTLVGVGLTLPISTVLWKHVGPLRWFQFPWRFLMYPALGTAVFCGLVAFALGERRGKPISSSAGGAGWPGGVATVITLALVASGLPFLGGKARVPPSAAHTSLAAARLAGDSLTRTFVRTTSFRWSDHLPYGAFPKPTRSDADRSAFEVLSGEAEVNVLDAGPVRYRARIRASDTSTIRLNVYRDPGWDWRLNGQPAEGPRPEGRPLHIVRVPPGEHVAEAVLTRTAPRILGDAITLLSMAIVAGMALYRGRRDKHPEL